MDIKKFVQENWQSESQLMTLLGQPAAKSMSWNFGSVPTEKAVVHVEDSKIVRVQTWSGLSWSARGGYRSPFVDTGKPAVSAA